MNKELKKWEIATNKLVNDFLLTYFGGDVVTWFKGQGRQKRIAEDDDGTEFTLYDGGSRDCICDGYWVGDEVGDMLDVDGYGITLDNIIDALRYNISETHLFAYLDLAHEVKPPINLKTFGFLKEEDVKYNSETKKDGRAYRILRGIAKGENKREELDKLLDNK